jgi:iron complex transport system substrate-binding protein
LRIVCLSAETAELCSRLGVWDEVVAVSAFADQSGLPPKPVASGFSSGGAEFILGFAPDLILGYSDVQADLAAALIKGGATVLITNQRTLAETKDAMRLIARTLGREREGDAVVAQFETDLGALRAKDQRAWRVYFEEWPDPPISGIGWVGELIEALGGVDIFASRRGRAARNRIVTDEEVRALEPEIILASWCGKSVDMDSVRIRLAGTLAVESGRVFEIPSADILQPGPRLIHGARRIQRIFDEAEKVADCV